jgi:hypothetical protein
LMVPVVGISWGLRAGVTLDGSAPALAGAGRKG